jgi:anthrone oxygenase-like protein
MMFRRAVIYLSILTLGCVLGANLYNSVVDAPNWGASIPESVVTTRQYFAVADPGSFFRLVSPAAQVATFLGLIVCWRPGGRIRLLAAGALMLAVAGDILTFAYFYPRNALLFDPTTSPEVLARVWAEWSTMNHVRSAIVAAALVCALSALSAVERQEVSEQVR